MLHFYTLEISPTPVIYWRSSKWCLCFCFLYSILGGGLLGVRKGSPLNMVGRLLQNSTMYICMQQYWFNFNTGYFHSTTIYTGYLHSTTIFIQLQHWIFSFNDYIHSTSTRAVFVQDIENNTWAHGDMEFIFECSHRYRTRERSERVIWDIEYELIPPCIFLFII